MFPSFSLHPRILFNRSQMVKYERLESSLKIQTLSLCLIITSCILRWINIAKLNVIEEVGSEFNILPLLTYLTIAVILYGLFCALIGIFGLVSIYKLKKKFLVLWDIILGILVLINFLLTVAILILFPVLEGVIKSSVKDAIENALNNPINIFDWSVILNLQKQCRFLHDVSGKYKCCGLITPDDFNDLVKMECCIRPTPEIGCLVYLFELIKNYFYNLVCIPGGILFINFIINHFFHECYS
ncbi:hypothetical protein BpHYR1_011619 [Brachionus plicatilis]|uniref:Uncharacterized protein n=1 Tax=Brachionus plicatilis TaxID=10195 RepID=A0A3M7QVL6_BRAPC|nr:hypothetical protein BpHYR1_011619 [Brachionus plicatilis]